MGVLFLSLSLNFLDSLYYKSTVRNTVRGRWLPQYTPVGSPIPSFIYEVASVKPLLTSRPLCSALESQV